MQSSTEDRAKQAAFMASLVSTAGASSTAYAGGWIKTTDSTSTKKDRKRKKQLRQNKKKGRK